MRRMPAEWEQQNSVVVVMPNAQTDWGENLNEAMGTFVRIITAINYGQRAIVVCEDKEKAKMMFCQIQNLSFVELPYNDTWVRDFGPICVYDEEKLNLLDFTFDGWGGKFEAQKDNALSRELHKNWMFGVNPMESVDLVLEGGSVESDGEGTILTTKQCLLNPNRNGGLRQETLEEYLFSYLGATRVLWLEHGALIGDDTDAHIDTLARFVAVDTIAYVKCEDKEDAHYETLSKMEKELEAFRTKEGNPYTLVPLPHPRVVYNKAGERLPATYANFLILNSLVLMPTYGDEADKIAVDMLKGIYPEREIIPIPCLPLIEQGGSLHCSTMQIMTDKSEVI